MWIEYKLMIGEVPLTIQGGILVPLGKTFTKIAKTEKTISDSFEIIKRVMNDMNLKITDSHFDPNSFRIEGSEPMKWLSTNWPTKITVSSELYQGKTIIKMEAFSKGTSFTQDTNTNKFLDNFYSNFFMYLDA